MSSGSTRLPAKHTHLRIILAGGLALSPLLAWFLRLPAAGWWAAGIVWLALAALVLRWQRPSLGPLLPYDLIRSSRRGEQTGHRCLYVILLFVVLFWAYWSWFPLFDPFDPLQSLSTPTTREGAAFAASFFGKFMVLQVAIICLLTPIYVAPAIADERERRTLEYYFLTDLRDHEIVLGMLASRLAKMFLLLLTGLPVMGLLPLMGGVDPRLVIAGYVAAAALMISLGSICILVSTLSSSSLSAVVSSYAWLLGLLVVTLWPYPSHPLLSSMIGGSPDGSALDSGLWIGLALYVIIQLTIAICCGWIAVLTLRPAGNDGRIPPPTPLRENPSRRRSGSSAPSVVRPPIGRYALWWKELYGDRRFISSAPLVHESLLAVMGGLILIFLSVRLLFCYGSIGDPLGGFLQPIVRTLGTILGCVLLAAVAVTSSSRVSRELEMRTLETLLTLPFSRWDIVLCKWLGSILCLSTGWWVLLGIWAIGVAGGGLSMFALPLLIAATMVLAGFLASLGLWFSAMFRNTLRATLFGLLVALLIVVNPVGIFASAASAPRIQPNDWLDYFQDYLISPGSTLSVFAFRAADLTDGEKGADTLYRILAAIAALHVYLAVTVVLLLSTHARLRLEKSPTTVKKRLLHHSGERPVLTGRSS